VSGGFSLPPDWRAITLARFHYYRISWKTPRHFLRMKIDLSEVVSIKEASEIRGVSTQSIHELIKRGRLTVVKVSGRKFLLRKEIEGFEPLPVGRPRKDSAAKSSQGSEATKRRGASTTKSSKKKKSS